MDSTSQQTRLKQLERIVVQEQDKLFKFAYLRIGNRDDAEDLVQNVLLKLFCSEEHLNSIRNLEQYLFKSLHNQCLDYFRKKNIQLLPIDEATLIPDHEEDQEIFDEYLRIAKLLNTLPAEQQEVIRLRCTDQCKFKDIAKILGISLATVKSRYRYAIQHLQNSLNLNR